MAFHNDHAVEDEVLSINLPQGAEAGKHQGETPCTHDRRGARGAYVVANQLERFGGKRRCSREDCVWSSPGLARWNRAAQWLEGKLKTPDVSQELSSQRKPPRPQRYQAWPRCLWKLRFRGLRVRTRKGQILRGSQSRRSTRYHAPS